MNKRIPYQPPRVKILFTGHLMQGELTFHSEIGDEGELAKEITNDEQTEDSQNVLDFRNIWDD